MVKISKNLKKFRKASGLTQEQLAGRMNLTRQAISNWENDKSQPDIDSLAQLAEIFGISVEEMIYGDLKKVGVDENNESKINVMKIVLSVFGGLFIAAGLIVIFVSFWEDFPDFIKSACAFLPFTAGFIFAAFVYLKKKSSYVWREVAGVLWCVGVISTVALFSDTLYDALPYESWDVLGFTLNLASLVLLIPAVFLLKSVVVLPIYFVDLMYCAANCDLTVGKTDENVILFLILPLFAVGALFTHIIKNENDIRYKFCVWISALAFAAANIAMYMCAGGELMLVALIVIFAAYCLISEKQGIYSLPFRIIGTIGVCVSALVSVPLMYSFSGIEFTSIGQVFAPFTTLVFLGLSIYFVLIDFHFELSDALFYPASAAAVVVSVISGMIKEKLYYYDYKYDWDSYYGTKEKLGLLILVTAAIIGVSFILKGIRSLKLFELNVGIIAVFVALVMLVFSMYDLDMITVGLLLILFGASMLAANLLVSKQKKAIKEKEISD